MALPQIQIFNGDNLANTKSNDHYDGAVILFTDKNALTTLVPSAEKWLKLDAAFGNSVQLIVAEDNAPSQRVVIAPTGTLNNDTDDVRRYRDAAFEAGKRALKAGITSPLIYFADTPTTTNTCHLHWSFTEENDFRRFLEVVMLGLLEAAYEPIDAREHAERIKTPLPTFHQLGFVSDVSAAQATEIIRYVTAIETGRRVAKDIGSPDPERMSPARIVEYLKEQFQNEPSIRMTVIDDIETIKEMYPLAHAVTRASLSVPRHHPRFVHFEYLAPDQEQVQENLYFVGKGVTYDTGGADIKCSGHMRGMSRDKCGAAAVAGFLKTVAALKPDHVNIKAGLALVRNSVGSNSYVSDEILYSRNGTRVLVGNTDAEGRMVMTDLLCEFKQHVLDQRKVKTPASQAPSFLFTVATLTGHALRAYDGYGITLDNGFARRHKISQRIYDAGHVLADPFEISTLRREDVSVIQPGRSSEDIIQANDKPSTATNRGHQYPAAFMLIASGLDKHGLASPVPIGYTHLDIAGSAETMSAVGWSLTRVTGSPVAALTGAFLLK